MKYKFPLMKNNILKEDLKKVIQYLKKKILFLHKNLMSKNLKRNGQNGLG